MRTDSLKINPFFTHPEPQLCQGASRRGQSSRTEDYRSSARSSGLQIPACGTETRDQRFERSDEKLQAIDELLRGDWSSEVSYYHFNLGLKIA